MAEKDKGSMDMEAMDKAEASKREREEPDGKMENQEEADRKMDAFLAKYKDICDRLLEICSGEEARMQSEDDEPEERHEKGFLYTLVAEQIKQVAEHLAPENQKERVKEMGGAVMKPQAQILVEQGRKQGRNEGRMEKAKETAFALFEMGMDPDRIAKAVKYNVDTVRQWIDVGMAVAK